MTVATPDPGPGTTAELATEVVGRSGRVRLRATGTSMLPAVRQGDELLFERVADATYAAGDVVLVLRDERLVAHRVMQCEPAGLRTQGDSVLRPDPWVGHERVLGKLVGHWRDGRQITLRIPGPWRLGMNRWIRHVRLSARQLLVSIAPSAAAK
jgi:hypothetical protein